MFKFYMGTEILVGENVLDQIGENSKKYGKKALIVTDKGIISAGLLDIVTESLKSAGVQYLVYGGTVENPTVQNVLDANKICLENKCDVIIAVGGGSPIDCAKAVAVISVNGGNPYDYNSFDGKPFSKNLPILAVATTCGTGSEVSGGSVLTIPEEKIKFVLVSQSLFPVQAYLDPRMIEGLPARLAAATGMDALTHLIESYISKNSNVFSDGLCLQGIKIVAKHLKAAVAGDLHSRMQMMCASSMGAICFMQSGLGLVHAMAVTMGGIFGIHHGLANAVLLPYVMEFNRLSQEDKFRDIAVALGENCKNLNRRESAIMAIKAVKELNADIGIPANLRALGIKKEDIPVMAEKALVHPDGKPNKRNYELKDIKKIYEEAL